MNGTGDDNACLTNRQGAPVPAGDTITRRFAREPAPLRGQHNAVTGIARRTRQFIMAPAARQRMAFVAPVLNRRRERVR